MKPTVGMLTEGPVHMSISTWYVMPGVYLKRTVGMLLPGVSLCVTSYALQRRDFKLHELHQVITPGKRTVFS